MSSRFVSVLLFALLVPSGALRSDPATDSVVMRVASLKPGGDGVAIRWTIRKGWLPEGGFNIYRIENGVPTRLNSELLGAKRGSTAEAAARWKISDKSKILSIDYKTALSKASHPPAEVAEESVRAFSATRHSRPPSARPVFDAIGEQIKSLRHTPGPSLPSSVADLQLRSHPVVAPYVDTLRAAAPLPKSSGTKFLFAPQKPGSGLVKQQPLPESAISPVDEVRTLRSNLLAGALIHPEMATDLGLAFDDTKAAAGGQYQYVLRAVDSTGKESSETTATATIAKVGADTPLIPTGLIAHQLDEQNVGLRWERPTVEQTDAMGMPSYQVYRLSGAGTPKTSLSRSPVVLGDIPVSGGRHLEPISFVQDQNVPVGEVSYQLVQTDMFGRNTESEILKFQMEDWRMPSAPGAAQADLKSNDVIVAWQSSVLVSREIASSRRGPGSDSSRADKPDPDAQYRVYREDIEQNNAKRELLTTMSLKGESLDLNSARSLRAVPNRPGRLDRIIEKSGRPNAWLHYVDHNVPNDHKYRYLVTAVYPKNNMESTGTVTTPVLVPLKVAPPPPGNVKLSLKTIEKSAGTPRVTKDSTGRFTIPGRNQRRPIKLPASFANLRQQDTGAVVTISWDPVAGTPPISYRVYRASATGLFKDSNGKGGTADTKNTAPVTSNSKIRPLSPSNPDVVKPNAIDKAGPSTAGQKKSNPPGPINLKDVNSNINANFFRMPPATLRQVSIGKHVLRYVDDIGTPPDSSFALLGEIKDETTFTDDVPRSQAHRYVYRVIAVNRWGVPAGGPPEGIKGSEAKIRVPATMPPSAPAFISVEQDDAGNIDLQFRPNLEEENVTSYEIKRRLIPTPPKTTNPVAGASGIARFGIQPSASAMHALSQSNPAALIKSPGVAAGDNQNGYEVIGTKNPKSAEDGILRFRDPKVSAHQVYSYYVVAISQDNLRSRSGDLLCSTEISPTYTGPAKLNPVATCENVKLTWPVTAEAKGYIVERALKSSPTSLVQLSGIGTETNYVDHSVQPGESYSYRVIGVTADGNVTEPVQTEVTVPPK